MGVNASVLPLSKIYGTLPRVSIVGVGDEGNDVVSRIFEEGGSGAQCIAVNTDQEPLEHTYSHEKVLIPSQPVAETVQRDYAQFREKAARVCVSLITPLLTGADVAFIIVGMKEHKAAGVAPLVAEVARRSGAVTVGLAIGPFPSERDDRLIAYHGLAWMRRNCHTVAIADVSRTVQSPGYPPNLFSDSSNRIVIDMVSGLAETLACPSAVNIDLAAFRELMLYGGIAHVGIGHSSSALRLEEATIAALRAPLLYDDMARTRGVLLNVCGDTSLTVEEAEMATELVVERIGWNAPVVMGARIDESFSDGLQVSILLTGGAYPYIPGGYRRLPLEMYEMEPDGEEEGSIDLELDLDQLEEA